MTTQHARTAARTVTNGVDVTALLETIEAIEKDTTIAAFQFRAENRWMGGGHNRSTIQNFYGACREDDSRTAPFVFDADEPPVLLSGDKGANPVEFVLHGLLACLTTSMVYHAAARGFEIGAIESHAEGDLDLRGFLGMSDEVRRGYNRIRVRFTVESDTPPDALKALTRYSPVYEMVSKSVPVDLVVETR